MKRRELLQQIRQYMAMSDYNWEKVYTFVNGSVAQCFSFELETVLEELNNEELQMITEHFKL